MRSQKEGDNKNRRAVRRRAPAQRKPSRVAGKTEIMISRGEKEERQTASGYRWLQNKRFSAHKFEATSQYGGTVENLYKW